MKMFIFFRLNRTLRSPRTHESFFTLSAESFDPALFPDRVFIIDIGFRENEFDRAFTSDVF